MMGSWFIKQCDSPHIGDWIMLDIGKGITRIRKPGRVIAIDSTTITIEDEDGNRYTNVRSCFHPIEIDEEFLLANGFQIERKIQPNVVRYIRSGFHDTQTHRNHLVPRELLVIERSISLGASKAYVGKREAFLLIENITRAGFLH